MRYLATVTRKHLLGSNSLQLHSKETGLYQWVPAQGEISTVLADKLKPGTLVFAHLTMVNQNLQRIEEASEPIIRMLTGLTKFTQRYKDLEADIEAWKSSMQFQIQELSRREEELLLKAEELHMELTCSLDQKHGVEIPASLFSSSEL